MPSRKPAAKTLTSLSTIVQDLSLILECADFGVVSQQLTLGGTTYPNVDCSLEELIDVLEQWSDRLQSGTDRTKLLVEVLKQQTKAKPAA